jgi:hypothetical protein
LLIADCRLQEPKVKTRLHWDTAVPFANFEFLVSSFEYGQSARLRRLDLRKASGFPAEPAPFVLLRAGWKAQPSSLRGGACSGQASFGKAKPFRKSGGGAAARRQW